MPERPTQLHGDHSKLHTRVRNETLSSGVRIHSRDFTAEEIDTFLDAILTFRFPVTTLHLAKTVKAEVRPRRSRARWAERPEDAFGSGLLERGLS